MILTPLFVLASVIAAVGIAGPGDHFASISDGRGPTWYRDVGGETVTEIQDQDLFFHAIGNSIAHARNADVVVVGSSLVAYAFDGELAASLMKPYGLTFYNMSFVGVASGTFTKQIIERHGIRPKLWIINADDGGGGGHFFSDTLLRSFSADVKTIAATRHDRITAYREVARRNLRWRLEDFFRDRLHWNVFRSATRVEIPRFYRDAVSGAYDLTIFPKFTAPDNAPISLRRTASCELSRSAIDIGRKFVRDLQTRVILVNIPNFYFCPEQLAEIAAEIGVDFAATDRISYTSYDNGGHLDQRGARAFTQDIITAIVETRTFQEVAQKKN